MSGIGEVAYMILLGWMRGLIDWFWRVVSGGSGDGLQWFLSKWKLWLVILLAGGLIIDWMMWLIRWRPYRVFLSRFRKGQNNAPLMEEAWDAGVGYYEPESMRDIEPSEWPDLTLGVLSETDPNWAEGVVIDADDARTAGPPLTGSPAAGQNAKTYFYTDVYEEPAEAYQNTANTSGYWEGDPDGEPGAQGWEALPYDEEEPGRHAEPFPAFSKPFEEDKPAYAETEEYKEEYYAEADDRQADQWAALSNFQQPEPPAEEAHYGRANMWPGAFPNVENYEAEGMRTPEAEHNYYADEVFSDIENDPLFSTNYHAETPPKQSRMLRRLRRSDEDSSRRRSRQSLKEEKQTPAFETRPQRLVQAVSAVPEQNAPNDFRTVTGKPVKRQGLFRLAATDDEPIPGLPPLQIEDPFYPKVMPANPDFSDDDGNYEK